MQAPTGEIEPEYPGVLEAKEHESHSGGNPKFGKRFKAAASNLATKLHIPGASHGGHSTSEVEPQRVSVTPVLGQSGPAPQWMVQEGVAVTEQPTRYKAEQPSTPLPFAPGKTTKISKNIEL